MPDIVHELLATEAAIDKLGARAISADEAGQLPRNAHAIVRNPTEADDEPGNGDCSSGAPTAVGC